MGLYFFYVDKFSYIVKNLIHIFITITYTPNSQYMSLYHKVEGSFAWKQSDELCAKRLRISVESYREIKEKIKANKNSSVKNRIVETEENLQTGTGKIVALTSVEPRSPEEVEILLKILGSKKWRLSTYYNKQQNNGLWLITGLVTQKKLEPKELLEETLKNFKPTYLPSSPVYLNESPLLKASCGILSIQDLHFGKEGNGNITANFKRAVEDLIFRARCSHKLEKIIYVFGGDILNMDTFSGTTTSGTPVDNEQRAQNAYNDAFDAIYWSIHHIKQFCKHLQVVYLPGNHDRLSSYHLAHAISKCFKDPAITFDVEYAERKVVIYGDNFFAFEHGDVNTRNTPLIYATEFSVPWGLTSYRTCYIGHMHKKKTTEYVTEDEQNGFSIKILPSLCASDYWHYHNKFTGAKRQAIMEIHDATCGKVSEFIYTV